MEDRRFTIQKLSRRIEELKKFLYLDTIPLELEWQEGKLSNIKPDNWQSCLPDTRWGRRDIWVSFRTYAEVPEKWIGKAIVAILKLASYSDLSGPEGLVYLNGQPYQGLDQNHTEILLTKDAEISQKWIIEVEEYTSAKQERDYKIENTFLAVPAYNVIELYYNAKVAFDVVNTLAEDDYERKKIVEALDKALLLIDWRETSSQEFYKSLVEANHYLAKELYEKNESCNQPKLLAVGHAHLDIAWLWTLAQTREKAARTFSTVLRLMEQYPEYYFTQSQAQLYQFIKEDYPSLLKQITNRVKEGRWEVIGGTWVEMDCNIPSGESFVRQFLLGNRFFEKHFGSSSSVLWLPDVFGFSWALPQIIMRTGLRYFMTTKISWNEYNKFPYDSFMWRGIDGTEILTHFINTPSGHLWFSTFNATLEPWQIKGAWKNYKQKASHDEVLLTFGIGDGGGGPTTEMLEYGRRLRQFPGSPYVSQGRVEDFFNRLEKNIPKLPIWNGELYLEYHRGTLTTQARNKLANRKSELLYHNAELFSVIANIWGAKYPRNLLNKGWKLILLNQFHDIIPGSSIKPVYEKSQDQYNEIINQGENILNNALEFITSQIDLAGNNSSIIVFNPTSWARFDLIETEVNESQPFHLISPTGKEVPYQTIADHKILFYPEGVPSNGFHTYQIYPSKPTKKNKEIVKFEKLTFENRFFNVKFNEAGQIISWWDKIAQREILPKGAIANRFQAFEDKPLDNDAWDINLFYQDKKWNGDEQAEIKVLENGPLRASIEVKKKFFHSQITQNIYAYSNMSRLDFETKIEWHEKHILLKVAFPVNVHNTKATFDIQFGNVERPTHWNTSWDWARFETCAHKWVDLSEGNYGVSLLNNCKYGHDVKDNVIRLTLLRSPTEPDPNADEGYHEFTYSLLPHRGDWRVKTVQRAYELNLPLLTNFSKPHKGVKQKSYSLLSVDKPNVVLETVKRAEDNEEIIIRCYECYNQRGVITLTFGNHILKATECNLIERDEETINYTDKQIIFYIKPYQIRTFRVKLSKK
jgi:alpha-mannosidase